MAPKPSPTPSPTTSAMTSPTTSPTTSRGAPSPPVSSPSPSAPSAATAPPAVSLPPPAAAAVALPSSSVWPVAAAPENVTDVFFYKCADRETRGCGTQSYPMCIFFFVRTDRHVAAVHNCTRCEKIMGPAQHLRVDQSQRNQLMEELANGRIG